MCDGNSLSDQYGREQTYYVPNYSKVKSMKVYLTSDYPYIPNCAFNCQVDDLALVKVNDNIFVSSIAHIDINETSDISLDSSTLRVSIGVRNLSPTLCYIKDAYGYIRLYY